ncbi:hypothetical protein DLL80_23900 [Salmonella enterica subsp. enterica serovar Newport]|uniref:Uncharacterized protein n=1 Tax=Salmonella newport TaxID=108619 RepID=A0A5V6RMJ7_SALNE|nr:hypothetical protein [Salmonella enterica subsp. enterica serovar Newport]
MAAPENYPNLTNAGNGRKPGSRNKYTLYQEEQTAKQIVEQNYLGRWMDKLDYKIMNDKIRPEAIAPAIEKIAKYAIRTATDQVIIDSVLPDSEQDIDQQIAAAEQNIDLLKALIKR